MIYDFAQIMRMLLDGKFKSGQVIINSNTGNTFYTAFKSDVGWSLKRKNEIGYYTPLFGSAQINGKWRVV